LCAPVHAGTFLHVFVISTAYLVLILVIHTNTFAVLIWMVGQQYFQYFS